MRLFPLAAVVIFAGLAACQRAPETIDQKVEALLGQMTLDEKIGQMTQIDSDALRGREDDLAKYAIGSVLSGGNSNPKAGSSAQDWRDLVSRLDGCAEKTRLKIPLIYGIDAVHGNNNVTSATIFPHNIGLGATRDPALVERAARVTAEEVAGVGIDWTFAPCVAVARDERWGRTYESFGEDPKLVATMGAAAVRGLQTADLAAPSAVLSCTKHFLGDGGTAGGKDQGDTAVDLATLRRVHLPGYVAAIAAGTRSIMASFNSWNGQKMHAQRDLITGLLKGELKFGGFVVSDWAAIDQIAPDYRECVAQSINAGLDMIMIPHAPGAAAPADNPAAKPPSYVDFIENLKSLVNEGRVPLARVDDAVRRILRVKFELGRFEKRKGSPELFAAIGSPEHRAIARDCVRKSLVLLQNRHGRLPLSKKAKRIGVAGRAAADLSRQCGGWTLDWQDTNGMTLLGGTTILAAVKATVSPETEVVYSPDGRGLAGCDAILAVVGETPYAEFKGDRADLALGPAERETIANARRSGAPVTAVIVSGRPLIIDQLLAECDGVIAAWLPGSEGCGVTDVIFGDHKPTGKLPVSWPRAMAQIPVNVGDKTYDPLFPFGFGLSYE